MNSKRTFQADATFDVLTPHMKKLCIEQGGMVAAAAEHDSQHNSGDSSLQNSPLAFKRPELIEAMDFKEDDLCFSELCDGYSDYMDSDSEAFLSTALLLKREKLKERFNGLVGLKKSTRLNPQDKTSIFSWLADHQIEFIMADAYRFNKAKGKWTRKGPVVVCLLLSPSGKNRLLAYYLHGTMSVAFNMSIFPFMKDYIRVSDKVIFSTGGRNGLVHAEIEKEYSTVGNLCPELEGMPCCTVPAMRCVAHLSTVAETEASVWALKFSESSDSKIEIFKEKLEFLVNDFTEKDQQKRLDRLLNGYYASESTGTCYRIVPPSLSKRAIETIAQSGFTLSSKKIETELDEPVENAQELLGTICCSLCDAELPEQYSKGLIDSRNVHYSPCPFSRFI